MSFESKRDKIAEFSLAQARRYQTAQEWGRSFPHYLVVGQLKPEIFRQQYLDDFLTVVGAFSLELEKDGKHNKVLQVYEQATEILPDHPKLNTNYASVLFKQGKTELAEKLLRKVLSQDPNYLLAKDRLENLASSLLDRWHFPMLNDRVRNSKFEKAIENRVKNGCDTVLDVGTGTGLLSLYAAKAGAKSVYACESSEVMAITAREVFEVNHELVINPSNNRFSNGINNSANNSRIKLIPKLSLDLTRTDVPEPIQLLITETLDAGLLGEHILTTLHHAWQTHLQYPSPGNPMAMPSCVIPCAADFYVVPIQCQQVHYSHSFIRPKHGYLDLSNLRIGSNFYSGESSQEPYSSEDLDSVPGGFDCLAQPKCLFSVDFSNRQQIEELVTRGINKSVTFPVTKDGTCHAIAAWFTLHLDEAQKFSTAPRGLGPRGAVNHEKTCWQQAIFPITPSKITSKKYGKLFKDVSEINATFKIHNHVEFVSYEVSTAADHEPAFNGNGCASRWEPHGEGNNSQLVELPSSSIRWLNCDKLEQVAQWLAYYASNSESGVNCANILDLTGEVSVFSLQLAKTSPGSRFTLKMDVGEGQRGKVSCLLDVLAAIAKANQLPLNRFSCITELPESTSEKFNLCLINPVQPCGRLDQSVMLSLHQTLSYLVPRQGLILPHKLQLWAQIIESQELCDWSHLRSNEPVSGFRIADQINILAVTHQQDLNYQTMQKKVLSEPFQIREINLTNFSMEREFVSTKVNIIASGKAHAVIYWFIMDYGWNLYLSTLASSAFSQCAVMCKETPVDKNENLEVSVQSEEGLLFFHVKKSL